MQIRCVHCAQSFVHEVPPYERASATAVCPVCGRDTPATDAHDGAAAPAWDGGADARVYCFNCGKAMAPREGELIPVCDDCRQEQADGGAPVGEAPAEQPVADWMIRKSNKKVYGPFPADTIIEWIRAKKILADEEIAHIGGAWRLFGQHEEFRRYFEGTAEVTAVTTEAQIDFRRRSPIRDAVRSAGRGIAALVVLGAVGGGAWWLVSNDILVVNENTVSTIAERVDSARSDAPTVEMSADLTAMLELLASEHPEVAARDLEFGSSMEYAMRGRTLMLRDTVQDLQDARKALEIAVLLDRGNPLATAGLAELYNLLAWKGQGKLELQRKSIYLLDMAEATQEHAAEVLRARAAFYIYSGAYKEGVDFAEQALAKNPGDAETYYLLGMAAMEKDQRLVPRAQEMFDKALELDSGFHQVELQLGRGAELGGDLHGAIGHYQRKLELDPRSAEAHARLGAIFEQVGQRAQASQHYDEALRLFPLHRDAGVARAVLAYQVDGQPALAATILTRLVDSELDLRIRERVDALIHLAAARRLAGDLPGSLQAADRALEADRIAAGALFQKGVTLTAMGRADEAVPLFTRADSGDLGPRMLARVYFFQGHAALANNQPQDAIVAFGRSHTSDPAFLPAYLWDADVAIRLGNLQGAVETILSTVGQDPLDHLRPRDPDLFYQPLPDINGLVRALDQAAAKETFAPALFAATAIAAFHDGRLDDAGRLLKRARSQDERNELVLFYQGLLEWRAERWRTAAALFEAARTVASGRGLYDLYLGDALAHLGRDDDSVAALEKGLGIGVVSPWAMSRLASALAAKGEADRARGQIKKALAADPAFVGARSARFAGKL